jgi:hypothetical protein
MNPTIICLFSSEAKMNFWRKFELLGALENLMRVSLNSAGVVQTQKHKLSDLSLMTTITT